MYSSSKHKRKRSSPDTTSSRRHKSSSSSSKKKSRRYSDDNDKYEKHAHKSSNQGTNSEEEIMFEWTDYKWELNKLFFQDKDYIRKGSDEYVDFWKFLKKYQGVQREKRIKSMCQKTSKTTNPSTPTSDIIGFSIKMETHDKLQGRLPPLDHDDHAKRLSQKRIEEFHSIIELYANFIQKQNFDKLRKLRTAQKALPIRDYKQKLVETLENNNVIILAGDTGCGKSTQVPQYLMEAGYSSIACTQPRRIACISLAKRVAYETLNEYGSKVGYQIRFETSRTQHTNIVFLTEGLLLRQVVSDPTLSSYNVIILDEIHERHLHTDFLLGVIKCLLVQRTDIKVVLMSATININLFYNYFLGMAPILQVPGRLFPITLRYCPIPVLEKVEKNSKLDPSPYMRLLQLIDHQYPTEERGDVLVFLSGMKEITTIAEAAQLYAQQSKKWIILSLHSTLSIPEQEKVFDVAPPGVRKCILSTNIAETSVTIDGIRFVIDSGKVKEMTHDPVCKIQKLKETWISQASAEQRKGRAGRTGPGTCFRLYSEDEYSDLVPYTKPEIQRVPLDSLILQMISMGLPSMKLFPFIDPPSADSLEGSIKSLQFHAALTHQETLTDVGQLLSALPVDIALGKMLIMGSLFHQIEPVLSLAALLSVQTPFTNKAQRDPDCISLNKEFQSDHGDPFTLLKAYREWLYIKTSGGEDSRKWCRRRGLEEQRFYEMTKLRQQFSRMLQDAGLQCLTAQCKPATGAERARKHGTLQQLRELKHELRKQGPRKAKLLKLDHGYGNEEEETDDVTTRVKDLDFRISYDARQLRQIYDGLHIESLHEILMLKIIISSGLYPNIALPDQFNNYKGNSEQIFHTLSKPGVTLHPNGVFACHPDVLQLSDADIVDLPGFSLKNPCSSRHQLLTFVSLLETNKAYLVNTLRIPTAQTCLLFANSVDTNVDLSTIVCDQFVELKFAETAAAQLLTFQAVQLRLKWQRLLHCKLRAAKVDDVDEQIVLLTEAERVEHELRVGLVDLFAQPTLYSTKRLLPADVKLLYDGPGLHTGITGNPFADDPPVEHDSKGGFKLTDFFTYNCLMDLNGDQNVTDSFDSLCPFCDVDLHTTSIGRLCHFKTCTAGMDQQRHVEQHDRDDSTKKKYFCDHCKQTIKASLKDIFKHRKTCV